MIFSDELYDSDHEEFIQQRRVKKARQAEQARQLQVQRQAEEARMTEKRAAEEAYRLQQQQAEEARIAKEEAEEEARIAKEKAEAFACRRCPEKFGSNTKLHEHVRTKHSKKPKAPSATAAVATPPSPPASSSSAPSALAPPPTPVALPTPPASPPTAPSATITTATTPKKPISWAEIASRPVASPKPSRLPRLTVKYGIPTPSATPPPSPHLQPILHRNSANSITMSPSTTAVKSHLTVDDLYTRFHGKPKPTSLTTIQIRLPSASPSGMRTRQMRITSYFKPAAKSLTPRPPTSADSMAACLAFKPMAQLASNRKHTDFNTGN